MEALDNLDFKNKIKFSVKESHQNINLKLREVVVSPKHISETGYPGSSGGEKPTFQCRRHKRRGFNPWVGKMPWSRNGNPLQYSRLENPLDKGDWLATVHGVAKSQDATEETYHMHIILNGQAIRQQRKKFNPDELLL